MDRVNKPKEDDYYVILDVDFLASSETITQAYRRLARKYHPDKHPEARRREAEVVFNRIKTAYDVLIDPHKRAIYDTTGVEGLKSDAWRMVKRHMTAEDIRDEYRRIVELEAERKETSQAKPRGVTTINLDATSFFPSSSSRSLFRWKSFSQKMKGKNYQGETYGDTDHQKDRDTIGTNEDDAKINLSINENDYLFDSEEKEAIDEEGDYDVQVIKIPSVEFTSMSISQSIDANFSARHGLTFSSTLQTRNGTGDSNIGIGYNHRFKSAYNSSINLLYQCGNASIFSIGGERSLDKERKTSINGRVIFLLSSYGVGLQRVQASVVHKVTETIHGTITFKEGMVPTLTTSILYLNARFGCDLSTSYKMSENNQVISLDASYRFNRNESKVSVSLALAQTDGISVEYGCETRLLDINTVGAAIQFGLQSGVTLKLRLTRANQLFSVPILLSDELHSSAIFYGTALPLVAYTLFDRYYVKKYHIKT